MVFESELDFEKALIDRLVGAGWVNHTTGQPEILRYKTEKDLIQNWANILFENNNTQDRLNGAPLTGGEMQQIMEQIKTLRTPVRLNAFINGKTVIVKRDNPADQLHYGREISLKIYDRQEIAGGQSRYQIAEQPVFSAKSPLLNSRRGDFALLINGMPVIHVELKKSNTPVSRAAYQIKKYAHEGVFTGLFSLVQFFVAMTPEETIYFANPGPDGKFNADYYFHWADFNNNQINDWERIASGLLSIPMAHQMVGFYTVADGTDGILKVMRSYQYYAASAISNVVAKHNWSNPNQRGGYIWHTTGSGKTMTSFKSAQLIADSGNADKVVFLMDRIELGVQSLQEYRGFAGDLESVQATENTGVLATKLKSIDPADTLIVTSIQKMSRILEESGYNARDIDTINNKRIVFIVDECHRSTFGEMMIDIKKTFKNAMFFGFTGTPIHGENAKKMNTTKDIFGDELHRYSIADGLRDKNVLGFDPTKVLTYKDDDLREAIALQEAGAANVDEVLADPKKEEIYYHYWDSTKVPMAGYVGNDGSYICGIEDMLPAAQYDRDEHRRAVIEDIRKNWLRLSRNNKFHAIFATSSIPESIRYYRLFKQEAPEIKIAILFDPNIDNNPGAIFKEDGLLEILEDYNSKYGTYYTLSNFAAYKKDVSLRLAHKSPYTGIADDREKQIDLLIVVDQMLTGFDSKYINTLYLDKVLHHEGLLQAFSRTNRLCDPSEKPFGIIRYYRKPHTMEKNTKESIELYSGNRPHDIFVSKLGANLRKMNSVYTDIKELFESAGVENFETLPDDRADRGIFAKLFREFNRYLEAARIQGFDWDKQEYTPEETGSGRVVVEIDENIFLSLALRYKELFALNRHEEPSPGEDDDFPYEIDAHLIEINTEAIDHQYMESRFRIYTKELQEGVESTKALTELHKSFSVLSQEQQKYASIFLTDVQQGNIIVDEDKTLIDYINKYQADAQNDRIRRFAYAIGLDEHALRDFMAQNIPGGNINEFGRFNQLVDSADRSVAAKYFESIGQTVPPRLLHQKIDQLLGRFIVSGGFDIDEK